MVYKLEYNYDDEDPSDMGVYIQLKHANPPVYQSHINKEDYEVLPAEEKHDFITNLFLIAGVVEVSSKAYRIWFMKHVTYDWEEVLYPVLYYLAGEFNQPGLYPLPGSAEPDGGASVGSRGVTSALTLDAPKNRRDR